jgi:DNA-binding NarL/FixJ family response regulator
MAGKTIVIVDDSLLITERLQAMLRELENIGSVECTGDYPSALQLLVKMSPDIVLLDINLPGRSGLDLLRHIKTNYPASIVIMLTNQSGDFYRNICKKLGADYFIDKSKEFEDIPVIVSSLMQDPPPVPPA